MVHRQTDRVELEVWRDTTNLVAWSLPDLAGAAGRYGFFTSHAAGARVGDLVRPGSPPFITSFSLDATGEATLTWRHGQPPYVIEGSTNVTGGWFDLAPATHNMSRKLPVQAQTLFFRVRAADPEP